MNPKNQNPMSLLPFVVGGCIWLALKLMSTPSYRSFAQRRIDFMKQRYRDLKHKINFTPTTTALESVEDEIHEFFQLYKFEQGVKGFSAELHSELQNKREELRGFRRVRA
jgi:hypothetical protein